MFLKKIVVWFICFFSMVSCYGDIDFKQIEDYTLTPEIVSPLIYFTVLPNKFFNGANIQQPFIEDIADFRAFEDNTLRGNVVKIVIDVEIKNEFDRSFGAQIDLLNEEGEVTYTINRFAIPANDLNYVHPSEEILIEDNFNVKDATKVRVRVTDSSARAIDVNDTTEFQFKSSLKVFLELGA